MERNKWWWYLHEQGTIQAKRYWWKDSDLDLEDAYESPFVVQVVRPFEADTREEALDYISNQIWKNKK